MCLYRIRQEKMQVCAGPVSVCQGYSNVSELLKIELLVVCLGAVIFQSAKLPSPTHYN